MKKIMIMMVMLVAAIATVNAQNNKKSLTAQDSIKILLAQNAKLQSDLETVTVVGDANKKGCLHLHLDTLNRKVKGIESCNGFYLGAGAGYDYLSYEVNGNSKSTQAAVYTVKAGYRHYWSRQEISFTGSFGTQEIEGLEYSVAKVKVMQYFDVLRFKKAEEKHSRFDPYLGVGISYNMITSKTSTNVGNIPYEGNNFRGEFSVGTLYKVGTFNNGHTTQKVYGKNVRLKRKSEFFLDFSINGSYGTLAKPRLAEAKQPVMKCFELSGLVTGIVKF